MLAVAWLIVVNRPKPSVADAALAPHGLEPGPVLPAEVSVGITWVIVHSFTPT